MRRVRELLRPKWLALHVFVVVACITMVLLGRWQLRVSNSKHFDLQNFGYALQWWAFTIFAIVMWIRVMRDVGGRKPAASLASSSLIDTAAGSEAVEAVPPVAYQRYVMPQSSTSRAVAGDSEHAAYNDYLTRLALSDLDAGGSD